MGPFAVIFPAAGKSSRFGDPKHKKIYADLDGRAVWLHAVEPFVNRDDVGQMILAIAPEDRELFERRYRASVAFMNIRVIEGGAERSDTVARALEAVDARCEFVAIHDAARPCLGEAIIDAVFAAARVHVLASLFHRWDNLPMDLNEMLVFARVVQAGSFTRAARQLDMPKSTVSRKISELEDRVGARLIQRTTRQLGLTDAGRVYYQHSARIMAEVEEAEAAVTSLEATPRGLLRVSAPLSFAMLGPIVAAYLKRHPAVQVELTCTDRQVDLVEEGYDVAIRAGQLGDSTLVARSLGAIKRVLVAAPSYCKRHGTPRAPAELAEHACISFAAGATPNTWTLHSDEKKAIVRITPRLTVNDFAMMRDAARAQLGIALMPQFACAADVRAGRLRHVLPDWRSSEAPVHALYPTARHLSPKVSAFIELVRERLHLHL